MNKFDRKVLEEKEKQLRKELNEASDEFEQQFVKAAGIVLLSGLVSYGIYKFLAPSKKQKTTGSKKQSSSNTSNTSKPSTLTRVINAALPLVISEISKAIDKSDSED